LNIISLARPRVNGAERDNGPPARHPEDSTPGKPRARLPADAYSSPEIPLRDSPPPVDEAELVRRLAAGDVTAVTTITRWLWEPLAAYAYRIVADQDVAADIAQEACVRLWQSRGRTPPSSLRPYLFRITRNLAFDYLKTRRTRFRLLSREQHGRVTRTAAPDEVLEHERVSASVQRAIQELPQRRREVFALAYLQGLSYAEVGDIMGISPKTVQNQMTAALAQLRKTLRPLIDERRGHGSEGKHGNA
jgi:RNA polymerase sigma-70 factor (ECF subfamily)